MARVIDFENAQTKQFSNRFRTNLKYHIESAESMYTQAPPFLLAKFSKQMMDEHAGYIAGLKTSLNILDSIIGEMEEEEEDGDDE